MMRQWLHHLQDMDTAETIQAAIRLSILIFAVWFLIMLGVWMLADLIPGVERELTWSLWSMLEGASSAAAFSLAIGGGVIALVQISEAVESRNLDIYKDGYDKLMQPEEVAARRWIYQNLPDDPDACILMVADSDEARDHIKRVMNLLDYFGFLVDQRWVSRHEIIGWFSPIVVKLWEKIEPVFEKERADRPEEPDYYEHAYRLVLLCRDWRAERYGDLPDIIFDDSRM